MKLITWFIPPIMIVIDLLLTMMGNEAVDDGLTAHLAARHSRMAMKGVRRWKWRPENRKIMKWWKTKGKHTDEETQAEIYRNTQTKHIQKKKTHESRCLHRRAMREVSRKYMSKDLNTKLHWYEPTFGHGKSDICGCVHIARRREENKTNFSPTYSQHFSRTCVMSSQVRQWSQQLSWASTIRCRTVRLNAQL